MDSTLAIPIALVGAWLGLVVFAHWIRLRHIRPDDFEAAMLVRLIRLYARVVHRLRVEGRENIPSAEEALAGRGLIVAANHTAGIDPVLIQTALDFEPRWMMAEDMRASALEPLWRYAEIIFVDRTKGDSKALRTALRHVQSGKVLGVFPEGFIERPAEHLLPFRAGIGLLIKKSGAPVLPIVVDGTPQAPTAWGSLHAFSRSRLRVLPMVHYEKTDLSPDQIAADLHRRFAEETGWPDAPRTPIITPTRRISAGLDGGYVDERGEPVSDAEARAIAEGG